MISAIRNLTLALLVVSLSASPELAAMTVLAYGLVMYVGAALAIVPMRRADPRASQLTPGRGV